MCSPERSRKCKQNHKPELEKELIIVIAKLFANKNRFKENKQDSKLSDYFMNFAHPFQQSKLIGLPEADIYLSHKVGLPNYQNRYLWMKLR